MRRQPLCSVVIPAYCASSTIGDALISVFSQESAPLFEVIVVDDGSTDDTAAVVERDFPEVRLIRKANGGPGSARNRGVAEARGDIVLFLDADDKMLEGRIGFQASYMLAHPDVGLTFGNQRYEKDPTRNNNFAIGISAEDSFEILDRPFARLITKGNFIANTTSAVRRDIYLKYGSQPEDIFVAEDYEMNLRMALHAPVAGTLRYLSWYRAGNGSNLMSSTHAYLGPVVALARGLQIANNHLTPREQVAGRRRLSKQSNALLRHDWIQNGRRGVVARTQSLGPNVPQSISFRWKIVSILPAFVGRTLRQVLHVARGRSRKGERV